MSKKKGLLLGIYLEQDGTIFIDGNTSTWNVETKEEIIDAINEIFKNSKEELIEYLNDTHSWN